MPYSSHGVIQYGSSASSTSRESRRWTRGNQFPKHSTSDGHGLFFSSPSDLSLGTQWTPPGIQAINIDDYGDISRRNNTNDQFLRLATFTPEIEGTSANPYVGGPTSSRSDSSESEFAGKPCLSSHHNSSSRHFSMSKLVHPLALPTQYPREASCSTVAGSSGFRVTTPQREPRWSSASSGVDISEVSKPFETEIFSPSCNSSVGFKCGLCGRFLSQRSPWSTRRIVRSGDLPVASVLSCRHVFHAECMDQTTTTKAHKHDPSCPLCHELEESCPEHRNFPMLKSGFPKLKPVGEDGPSRLWGCGQVGDCVEGALHAPPRNTMLLLNRNRMKRNLSSRSNATKAFPGKLRKSVSVCSERLDGTSSDQGAQIQHHQV